jgi:hypothetical protein
VPVGPTTPTITRVSQRSAAESVAAWRGIGGAVLHVELELASEHAAMLVDVVDAELHAVRPLRPVRRELARDEHECRDLDGACVCRRAFQPSSRSWRPRTKAAIGGDSCGVLLDVFVQPDGGGRRSALVAAGVSIRRALCQSCAIRCAPTSQSLLTMRACRSRAHARDDGRVTHNDAMGPRRASPSTGTATAHIVGYARIWFTR